MGQIRGWQYDAVIGIGVTSYEPRSYGIDGRITWVGVGPRRMPSVHSRRAPVVTFDRFSLFDAEGPLLRDYAPTLAAHFFAVHRRFFFSNGLREPIQRDIDRILELAKRGNLRRPPTEHERRPRCKTRCPPRRKVEF
jgi:hypothetical protein